MDTRILHVIDIGDAPLQDFDELQEKLWKEERVVGVWFRKERDWGEVIKSTNSKVFEIGIVEEVNGHEIKRMILFTTLTKQKLGQM